MEQSIIELENTNDALNRKIVELQQQMQDQLKQNKNQQLQSLQKKCNELHNQNLQLIIESDQIKKQLETTLIKQVQEEDEFKQKLQQYDEKLKVIEQQKSQIDTLTQTLNQSQQQYKNVMKQLFDNVPSEQELQIELNKLRDLKQKEKSIQSLSTGHDLVQQLQQQNEQLQSENKSLNNILEQKVQITQDLQDQIHELQNKNQQLQAQQLQLQQQLQANQSANLTQSSSQYPQQNIPQGAIQPSSPVIRYINPQNIQYQSPETSQHLSTASDVNQSNVANNISNSSIQNQQPSQLTSQQTASLLLTLLQDLDIILSKYSSLNDYKDQNVQQIKAAFIDTLTDFLHKQKQFYISLTPKQQQYFEENLQIYPDDQFVENLILFLNYDFEAKNCQCCQGRMLLKQQLQQLGADIDDKSLKYQLIEMKWKFLFFILKLQQKEVKTEEIKRIVNESKLDDFVEIVNNL